MNDEKPEKPETPGNPEKPEKSERKDGTAGICPAPLGDDQMLFLPQMSYTAIMSSREMAGGFLRYLIVAASKMIPRQWTAQDLQDILTFVIEGGESPFQFIEGRYLRRRIQDQIVRAERYNEPFSLLVIKTADLLDADTYTGLVELLIERLRKSDMVFLYKQKIAILLPHTPGAVLERLIGRINRLAAASEIEGHEGMAFATASFPSSVFMTPYEILDWIEDQLRN